MRNSDTDKLGEEITRQYREFGGTKPEFMAQLIGVTANQQVDLEYENPLTKYIKQVSLLPEPVGYFYCTVVRGGVVYSVYSYGEDDWFCKC